MQWTEANNSPDYGKVRVMMNLLPRCNKYIPSEIGYGQWCSAPDSCNMMKRTEDEKKHTNIKGRTRKKFKIRNDMI